MIKFNKPEREIKYIFIHCSSSDLVEDDVKKIEQLHTGDKNNKVAWNSRKEKCFGWSYIGYQYIIDYKGKIHECRPLEIQPASQYGMNKHSISICLLGNGIYSNKQFKTLKELCKTINLQYNDKLYIYGHRDINRIAKKKYHTTKDCPKFEVKEVLNLDDNNLIKKKVNKLWKKTLSVVAPTVATALGGPLAGTAVKQISQKLLGKDSATEEELSYAIGNATPEQLNKLKEIETNFKIEMEKLGVDLERINAGDRDSARKREMELKDKTPSILGFFIMFGFFGLLGFLLFYAVPTQNEAIFNIMLGALGTMATGVVSYYFGSSAGSRAKDLKGVKND